MKIVFLTPYFPYPPDRGGLIRTFHLLRSLAAQYDVHLVSIMGDPRPGDVAALESLGITCRLFSATTDVSQYQRLNAVLRRQAFHIEYFYDNKTHQQVNNYIEQISPELIVVDELVMVPYAESFPQVKRVLALQNIDHQTRLQNSKYHGISAKKAELLIEYVLIRDYFQQIMQQNWDYVVVCSESDAHEVRRYNKIVPIEIVPNGVDTTAFNFDDDTDDLSGTPLAAFNHAKRDIRIEPHLLFVGSMFYYPNINAMDYFLQGVYPLVNAVLPNAHLWVVGHEPPPHLVELGNQIPNVHVTGSVDSVRPYYRNADIAIVPLQVGGGTSLKVVEAMAMGRPIVSSSIGFRGINLTPDEDLLVADTASEFARHIISLSQNEKLRNHIVHKGYETAQKFDWTKLMQAVADIPRTIQIQQAPLKAVNYQPSPPVHIPDIVQSVGDKPLRILGVSNLFPPYVIGGYELLAHQTLTELANRGHEVNVATGYGDALVEDDHIHSIYAINLDDKENEFLRSDKSRAQQLRQYLFHPAFYQESRKLMRWLQPDIVSFWNLYLLSVAPMVAANHLNLPSATHLTDQWLLYNIKNLSRFTTPLTRFEKAAFWFIKNTLQPILYRQVNPQNLIVPSNALLSLYLQAGFTQDSFMLLPHGIDTNKFPYVERTTGPDDTIRLLYVGQLWAGKGPQDLIRALGVLKRKGKHNIVLDIYGKGVEHFLDYLKQIIAEEDIADMVNFCGTVSHDELVNVYSSHDVMVFPSVWDEPFPLAPLEGMSTGLPIISSDAGGTPEAIRHGQDGLVFAAGNVEHLARTIEQVLDNPDHRKKMGGSAADRARTNFDFNGFVDRIEALYRQIVWQRARG